MPQVRVDPDTLPDSFSANVPLARPGRCQAPLKDLPEERLCCILTAASQFRLQRKAARLRNIVENHGRDEALFQEIAAALGYKENKLAFTLLAQRLPLGFLRKQSEEAEAILFGVAGFLEAPDLGIYAGETRGYVRKLWDRWWPHRDGMQRLVLPAKLWRLSGTRPLNHPQRRLGALATLINAWPSFIRSLAKKTRKRAEDFFLGLRHPFWNFHYTLASDPAATEMALVGESRIAEILANVLLPLLPRGRPRGLGRLREYCRRAFPTAGSKPAPPGSLATIRAARVSREPSRSNKGCFKSTKTSACRITPIARNARSPSRCANGNESALVGRDSVEPHRSTRARSARRVSPYQEFARPSSPPSP